MSLMQLKNSYLKRSVCLLLAVGMVFASVPMPNVWAEDIISISGEWEVFYEDRALGGGVKGIAVISEDESSVEVVLEHPDTGKKYTLHSTEIRRDKDNIEIILEGRSPESDYVDGYGYPDQAITIPNGSSKISVSVGDNKAEKAIKPRRSVDLDRVTIKFIVRGYNQLQGVWSYEAEPITERDQDGYGRVGRFEFNDDGTGLQQGWEVWRRPEQLIVGSLPINNQKSILRDLRIPAYPHPFMNNENQDKYIRRTILIFGKNFPKDWKSAKFESGSEFVTYGNVKFPDSTFLLPGDLNPFVRGKKKLLEYSKPEEHEGLLKLDFLVVEVKILKGVMPGLQSFKLNDEESTWMLEFGDNRASISFVRKINPDLPRNRIYIWKNSRTGKEIYQVGYKEDMDQFDNPWRLVRTASEYKNQWIYRWKNTKTGEERTPEGPRKDFVRPANPDNTWKFIREVTREYEDTQDLFIPEYTRIEVRTELVLDVDKIDVTIGKNGKVLKFDKSPLVPAHRSADDPRVYRTQQIALIKASGSSLPPSTSKFSITVKEKDLLTASIAEGGLISVVPPPAKANMSTTPARVSGRISYLWKDYLLEAAICHDIEIKDWDRNNNIFVDKISKRLILEGEWEDLELLSVPGIVKEYFFGTKLETHFQLGDHAAMLLARETFLEMINEKIYNFDKNYRTEQDLWAFWLYVDPHRWNSIEHPIGNYGLDITVTGKNGKRIAFFETFYEETENRNPENIEPWIVKATSEALDQYSAILVKSRTIVEEMDSCDAEDLLMLTGNTFGAVEDRLVSRLMRLEEGNGTLSWKPDDQARLRVNLIAGIFDRAKSYERLSEADTQNLIAAAAIVTLPLHIGTGPVVGFIIAFSEVAFESALALDKYLTSQAEIEFAQGTADVLGYGRYRRSKAEEFDYLDLVFQVAMAIGQEWGGGKLFEVATESAVASFKQTYKFFQKGVRRLRALRGKALLKEFDFDLDAIPSDLTPADRRNISEYIMDSALVRNARRTLDDDQLKVLSQLDKKSAQSKKKKPSEMTPEEREIWREELQAREDARGNAVYREKWRSDDEMIAGGDSPPLKVPEGALQSIDTKALVDSMSDAEISELFEGGVGRILSKEDIIKKAAVIKEGKVPDWVTGKGSDEVIPPVKRDPTPWSEGDTVLTGKGDTSPPVKGDTVPPVKSDTLPPSGKGIPEDLLDIYGRRGGDIEELMKSGSETVKRALRGKDRDLALQILRSSPQRTPEQFQRALDLRKKVVEGDKTARYMDQAGEADAKSAAVLKDGHRDFKIEGPDSHGFYKVRELDADGSPNTAKKALIEGKFEDGTFTMSEAFIYDSKPWIDVGLDIPLVSGKGVPTIQFMFLRAMKKFGIGFGGSGEKLTKVVLDNVVNTPTVIHIHWIRRTYFLGKTLKELEADPQFAMLVMETPAVVMAKDLLEKAGYEVTGLRIVAKRPFSPPAKGVMTNYKPLRGQESADEFFDRFRLPEDEKVLVSYDIELEVKPVAKGKKPKKALVVEEFDPDAPDGLDDALQPKKPLAVEKMDSDMDAVNEWAPKYMENIEAGRVARKKAKEELMKRRVDAPHFEAPEGGRLRNDKVGHLVEGDNGRLKTMMKGYKAIQLKVYEGNINKYTQDMINNKFDWEKIPKDERIVLSPDGKMIVHGHHRFIAAHLASQATGRPVTGGSNPIIPKEGFAPPKKWDGSLDSFDIKVEKGFRE
jgi:hypothetical protein